MSWLTYIVFGAVAGFFAYKIAGREGQGCLMNVIMGIIGSFVGGVVFEMFGRQGVTGFNFYSFAVAIVGAVIVIVIARLFTGRR
jgi:uncharacterized membrane protein YeaQ/YmgE (transglycosylase-associated protein family)